eukprot:scaffold177_cov334-Pavlova_lutheri.AAC.48
MEGVLQRKTNSTKDGGGRCRCDIHKGGGGWRLRETGVSSPMEDGRVPSVPGRSRGTRRIWDGRETRSRRVYTGG